MASKFIYLIRHGKYHERHHNPDIEGRLDTIGKAQARRTGMRMREVKMNRITSSTLPRAIETAKIIKEQSGHKRAIEYSELLCECLPSIPPIFAKRLKSPRAKLKAARLQMEQAIQEFINPPAGKKDEHHALICHGNVIRFLIARSIGVNPNLWGSLYINHGSVSILRVSSEGNVALLVYNNVEFMPAKLKTDSGDGLMLNFW